MIHSGFLSVNYISDTNNIVDLILAKYFQKRQCTSYTMALHEFCKIIFFLLLVNLASSSHAGKAKGTWKYFYLNVGYEYYQRVKLQNHVESLF